MTACPGPRGNSLGMRKSSAAASAEPCSWLWTPLFSTGVGSRGGSRESPVWERGRRAGREREVGGEGRAQGCPPGIVDPLALPRGGARRTGPRASRGGEATWPVPVHRPQGLCPSPRGPRPTKASPSQSPHPQGGVQALLRPAVWAAPCPCLQANDRGLRGLPVGPQDSLPPSLPPCWSHGGRGQDMVAGVGTAAWAWHVREQGLVSGQMCPEGTPVQGHLGPEGCCLVGEGRGGDRCLGRW